MKASIPEIGTVIRLEGGNAVVSMQGDASCRKCGAAAIGLCKGGMMQVVTARNTISARVGDTVKLRLVREVQLRGYVLAYVVPAAAFLLGILGGHSLGEQVGFPPLDIIAGFASLAAAAAFSFRRLKLLDAANAIEITDVHAGPWGPHMMEQCRGTGVGR